MNQAAIVAAIQDKFHAHSSEPEKGFDVKLKDIAHVPTPCGLVTWASYEAGYVTLNGVIKGVPQRITVSMGVAKAHGDSEGASASVVIYRRA